MREIDNTVAIKACPFHMPEEWAPPVPAFSANLDSATQATCIYVGVQRPTPEAVWAVATVFLRADVETEQATFIDRAGDANRVFIAYLPGDVDPLDWRMSSGLDAFLTDRRHLAASYGLWCETYRLRPGQFETLFSSPDSLEGVGRLAGNTVGPIREHAYWGGAEDRIPNADGQNFAATLDHMPASRPGLGRGAQVTVVAPANLCLIRSGQDLRAVTGEERADYDHNIEPALSTGLAFLAANPDVGCFESRYMAHCDEQGAPIDKTFGMQTFLSIGHMLEWAKSHPTHLAIFDRFQEMAERMQGQIDLRLWHEVAIMGPGDAQGTYVNCHAQTGLLPYTHALECPIENAGHD